MTQLLPGLAHRNVPWVCLAPKLVGVTDRGARMRAAPSTDGTEQRVIVKRLSTPAAMLCEVVVAALAQAPGFMNLHVLAAQAHG
ncbi:hypothetical protein [Corynebacterium kalinowskii]|uniref:hypothetical protein n=1 Tax=Corynebacterium kalinowskii TaxID=2675216 RepID=UPI0012E25273|nr:hypothetical protein [Corynebacterium kalinowskii]